ncbi:hypothetical protein GCM10028857_10660 [Salinarchaeum chitinilyticum]
MTASVKVDDEAKDRLEELQAEIRLETGTDVTQQELLSRLIDDAYSSQAEIVDSFRSSGVPLSSKEKEAMARRRFASGTETDEEDIDEILYR